MGNVIKIGENAFLKPDERPGSEIGLTAYFFPSNPKNRRNTSAVKSQIEKA
jgi:hypothetical protein